ncbi:VOC family protein [Bacillus gobiensis]|uniref:VOC family protein n=2 Tax=Bacillus gobiensis TaxID=1441095 RepID=UPI003D1C410F
MMKWHHVGIYVADMYAAEKFYQSMFHFQVEKRLTLDNEDITFLIHGNVRVELIRANDNVLVTNGSHMTWEIENMAEWMRKLRCKGLAPCEGPIRLKNGWKTVFYEGLNGEIIELIEL